MAVKGFDKRADGVVAFAREKQSQCNTWTELSNLVFGPGGPVMQAFPDKSDRAKFVASPQCNEVWKIIESLPEAPAAKQSTCSGQFTVRVPQSVHASLLQEAEMEGTSLNQLVLSKICVDLRALTPTSRQS